MADVVITIAISDVFKQIARRTSVSTETDPFYKGSTTEQKQYSQLHGEGDRITFDFVKEAAKEVLKCFISRQGDVSGAPFEIDRIIVPTSVKQKETVTLTGDSGYAYIMDIAPENKQITFNTSLPQTALDFVAANAAYYLGLGIVLTAYDTTIIFEALVAGVPFTPPTVGLQQLNMNGTTAHTTANQTASSTGTIVYRFSEATPSLAHSTAIKTRLTDNAFHAIVYYALLSLYKTDGNVNKMQLTEAKDK